MIGSSPARSMMKMRCSIERQFGTSTQVETFRDSFGQTAGGWREIAGGVPCHCWAGRNPSLAQSDARTATKDSPGMILPLDTDVKNTDRIGIVTDKKGIQLFPAMGIDAVLPRLTHIELRLREIN